ncbi:integral membrane protein MviN [Desulfotomaculum nigrificans CO-1-SRB]|uniref:Probable lipid II flippase MurJ n=1 Tax=Desulfotomaculum nigrificans (strain DSM 14880 / VKM B-2319 / CO-1-SRB) TaxID=868595 RepID=F6B5G0_DESCC|nr:murein biosynthesis integral membrane protein MurJ [Desulfotomaculum nigrificans]AEF95392.1 integral membrane protein MviN [Desulfotomaculum nigrificans CO-1-SRB]
MSTGKMIARATLVVAVINLLSRILGFVREQVIAYMFGATSTTDAYVVAYNIPNTVFAIVIGALATVVVPVFSEYVAKGRKDEAWKLFNTVITMVIIIFTVVTVGGIFAAPLLVKLTAPGLNTATAGLATRLTVIMLPILVFYGLSTVFQGLLNANQVFAVPALSVSFTNVVIIVSALTLGSMYGIDGLAAGTVGGFALAALMQIPKLRQVGFRFKFSTDWRHPGVRKVLYLVMPVAIGTSLNQIYLIIDRILASGLAEGSISALNYANRIILMPITFFVLAIGTAFYPTITTLAAQGKQRELADTVLRAIRTVILFALPAGVGLMVLSTPIIKLLFEHGEFGPRATAMTALALMFYAIGLVGQAANIILTRGFYAQQDTKTPVKLMAVTVTVNLIFSLLLIGPLKHGGLALANSIASLVNTVMLSYYLNKRIPGMWHAGTVKFMVQTVTATAVMAATAWGVNAALADKMAGHGTLGLAVQVGASISAAMGIFVLAIFLLRMEEAGLVTMYAGKFLGRLRPSRG